MLVGAAWVVGMGSSPADHTPFRRQLPLCKPLQLTSVTFLQHGHWSVSYWNNSVQPGTIRGYLLRSYQANAVGKLRFETNQFFEYFSFFCISGGGYSSAHTTKTTSAVLLTTCPGRCVQYNVLGIL